MSDKNKATFIKKSLMQFLRKQSLECNSQFSSSDVEVDEVMLNYIVQILEDLGNEDCFEENFDPEQFSEMITAYIPNSESIHFTSVHVTEWLFELTNQLKAFSPERNEKRASLEEVVDTRIHEDGLSFNQAAVNIATANTANVSKSCQETDEMQVESAPGRDENILLLAELFCDTPVEQLQYYVNRSAGDVALAAALLVECTPSTPPRPSRPHKQAKTCKKKDKSKGKNEVVPIDVDNELKDAILKYSYVDVDEDHRVHRPVLVKQDTKKLIRYLDNKVVSTKGERFTEIKKGNDEN